jgi:hypothetical protein
VTLFHSKEEMSNAGCNQSKKKKKKEEKKRKLKKLIELKLYFPTTARQLHTPPLIQQYQDE